MTGATATQGSCMRPIEDAAKTPCGSSAASATNVPEPNRGRRRLSTRKRGSRVGAHVQDKIPVGRGELNLGVRVVSVTAAKQEKLKRWADSLPTDFSETDRTLRRTAVAALLAASDERLTAATAYATCAAIDTYRQLLHRLAVNVRAWDLVELVFGAVAGAAAGLAGPDTDPDLRTLYEAAWTALAEWNLDLGDGGADTRSVIIGSNAVLNYVFEQRARMFEPSDQFLFRMIDLLGAAMSRP
jgi:hypothetical protein